MNFEIKPLTEIQINQKVNLAMLASGLFLYKLIPINLLRANILLNDAYKHNVRWYNEELKQLGYSNETSQENRNSLIKLNDNLKDFINSNKKVTRFDWDTILECINKLSVIKINKHEDTK